MSDNEDALLRSVALQNVAAIQAARRRAEDELLAAQAALRESEQRLRATFSQAAVGMAIAGLDLRFMEVNRKFAELLGFTADEMLGLTVADITYPDDMSRTVAQVERLLDTDAGSYAYEKRYRRKDGTGVWTQTTVTLLREPDGRPSRYLGVVEDISQRKQAEDAFQEESRGLEVLNRTGATIASELNLERLVQRVTDAATELSAARFGAFFYNVVNDDGESLLLYALSGAPREAFEKFGLPRNTPVFDPTFRGAAIVRSDDITKDPRYGTMAPHHGMPTGHLPVRSYLAVPVISRSGATIGGLFFGHPDPGIFTARSERLVAGIAAQAAVAIDNARLYDAAQRAAEERKRLLDAERGAREDAERMSRLKDEFLATLSHELRTPLSAILGWAQVLQRRHAGDADLQKALATIERNARAQTKLIDDLLDMSRITSGNVRLDIQTVTPVSFIEAAIETIRPAAEAKGIAVRRLLDPAAGPVSGDPGRLQQIVWNLLSNAVKFTPREGKIEILLQRVNSHVEISIADTGIGIGADFLRHMFERFRQADASTTRAQGGLGLGLSIVKQLVELHGGTVGAFSDGEGRGTTVTVKLPLTIVHRRPGEERVHPRASLPDNHAPRASPDLTGIKVLVVDDEADARDLVRHILAERGARVMTAASAEEALVLLPRECPDVMLTDVGMPQVDGYELLRRVRALGPQGGGKIPAVALTAFARSEDRTRALAAGFVVHLAKPVERDELVITIANVAGRIAH